MGGDRSGVYPAGDGEAGPQVSGLGGLRDDREKGGGPVQCGGSSKSRRGDRRNLPEGASDGG